MRKVVSPGSAPRAPWGQWIEGLESRRLLAATSLKDGGADLGALLSIQKVPVLSPQAKVKAPKGGNNVAPALITPVVQTYSGALNGKLVFTSGGHGWQWNDTLGRYATDRGDNNEIVEDFGNQEQMSFYADYALRAGATVIPMRPVGHQPNEVVLDNDSAGVTFSGSWSNSTSTHRYDEDYGAVADGVAYRFTPTTTGAETAVATYQPNIPSAGFYPVYTWVLDSGNRTDQLYRINHTGGRTELRVDHRKVGKGWIYLGTYHFGAGSNANGNVQISNNSPVAGQVIADAIRFGNGMGDYTDAGGGRGAVGLIDSDQGTPNQSALALYTGRQINQDMQARNGAFEHDWSTRTTHTFTGGFGEIDLGAGAEMDATIIEVAFHDSVEDAQLMRDPKVRAQMAKSTLDATLEYFADMANTAIPAAAPAAPASPRATVAANGNVTLNWSAGPTGAQGGTASGYRVYVSRDGKGFGKLADVAGTSYTIAAADLDGNAYYFRVAATNAGGESPMSYAVGARKNGAGGGGGTNRILVVNGFDRFDRGGNVRGPYAFTGDGLTDRVRPLLNNSFDYVTAAGEAIEAYTAGGVSLGFDSVQNEHVASGVVNLGNYRTVVWLSGEESTADETFSSTEQSAVASFVGGGGTLFVSGSEIGWDLDRPSGPTDADRSFYNNTLKADYVGDDAGTYTASAAASSIFAGMSSLSFASQNTVYDTDFPDVLATFGGSTAALNYSGGTGGIAATQWFNPAVGSGGAKVVNMAFPFETITLETRRNEVMARVLNFFQTAVSETPGIPDLVATSDSGSSDTDNITNRDNTVGKTLQFDVPGTAAGAIVRLFADGVQIGQATGVAGTTRVTTNGSFDLLDGARVITARQEETNKSESATSPTLGVIVDTVGPTVTNAWVGSSAWLDSFTAALGSANGYALPTDASQLKTLPWINVNRFTLGFNEDVIVQQDDLQLHSGATQSTYGWSGFTYDGTADTGTWSLPAFLTADKLRLRLDGSTAAGVTDVAGNLLDGEWTDAADAFPSGNGTAGGDFALRVNVLPGDVNQNTIVQSNDALLIQAGLLTTPGTAGYTIFKDVNGNGILQSQDFLNVQSRLLNTLPAQEPGGAPPVAAGDSAVINLLEADEWQSQGLAWAP